MKKIFVINGEAGCGKDTFVELCQKLTDKTVIWNVSMVDKVKEIAKACGWDGEKTPKARKFLSDLKDLCDDFNQMSYRSIEESIERFCEDKDAEVLFIHAREPKDIERICDEFGAFSLLVTREGYQTTASNHADANVYAFDYDYHVKNPGDSLTNYEKKAELFLDNIKVLHFSTTKEKEEKEETVNSSNKEFWVTNKEVPGYGYAADLSKLPIGTAFHVVNGAWDGEIVEYNGQKAVLVTNDFHSGNVWNHDMKPMVIRDNTDLVIEVEYLPKNPKTKELDMEKEEYEGESR